ncbi:MAG: hypothetical protein QCH96_06460 [Candidatus Thermoplasmatota archaeon]|nr:hypothetical protein [Candidatus Thermoplasmatota archaeon]
MKDESKTKTVFLKEDTAVLSYPVSLFIIVLSAALVFTMIYLSVGHFSMEWNRQQMQKTVDSIIYQVETLIAYADAGSVQTLDVSIPTDVISVVFGGRFIQTSDHENGTIIRDNHTTHMISYKMKNGQQYHSFAKTSFMGINDSTCAVLTAGTHTIILSLEKIEGETYVKIILS